MEAPKITRISLLKMTVKDSYEVMINNKNIDYKKHQIIIQVDNKTHELDRNHKIVTIPAVRINSNPLAAMLPKGNALRIKAFVYDLKTDKVIVAKIQEFVYNIVQSTFLVCDELLNTSPVILGWRKEKEVKKYVDFKIDFFLNKNYKTFVPLAIPDFNGNPENYSFVFNYSLSLSDIDELHFDIKDENDKIIYTQYYLKPVVIKSTVKPVKKFLNPNPKKESDSLVPNKSNAELDKNYTEVGKFQIYWEGFDDNGIYDSSHFNNKTFKASVTAFKDGRIKKKEVSFKTGFSQVNWVDVKIDRKNLRIDATLRVNLKDGGAQGLESSSVTVDKDELNEIINNAGSNNTVTNNPEVTYADWNKISKEALEYYKKEPIKKRTKSFEDLRNLALKGINQFWSRNLNNIGKGVKLEDTLYEVNVNAIQDEKGMVAPEIIYQTNTVEGRSRNFELSRKLFYYEGYLYYTDWKSLNPDHKYYINKGWHYKFGDNEDFKMVTGHEVGHEVLLAFGGHKYSKAHKKTSHWSMVIQDPSSNATDIPKEGEVDLMKYYTNYYDIHRTIIAEFDLLKLLWLSKLEIK